MLAVFKKGNNYISYLNFGEHKEGYFIISVNFTNNLQNAKIFYTDYFEKHHGIEKLKEALVDKFNEELKIVKIKIVEEEN